MDLTSQATAITYKNNTDDVLICQGMIYMGGSGDDLDGAGGEFEFTMTLGDHTVQPDPQLIWFGTATKTNVFTEQFPLYVGETVTFKIKSPNAADTSVYVRACIIDVGVESIRDDLATVLSRLKVVNVFDEVTVSADNLAAVGVVPQRTGRGEGVYPKGRARR